MRIRYLIASLSLLAACGGGAAQSQETTTTTSTTVFDDNAWWNVACTNEVDALHVYRDPYERDDMIDECLRDVAVMTPNQLDTFKSAWNY